MKLLKPLFYLLIFALFCSIAYLGYEIIRFSEHHQINKYDESNINHMKYGLFDVNTWKEKLTHIIVAEIKEAEITESNEQFLKEHVQAQLSGLIDKVDEHLRDTNEKSTGGWLKQKLFDAFVDVDDLKSGIPGYADQIVAEMTKEQTQKKLKEVVSGRVKKYLDQTFANQDTREVDVIVKRTGQKNKKAAMAYLKEVVKKEDQKLVKMTWAFIALCVLLFLISIFIPKKISPFCFFTILATLLCILAAGITCPMIDMEAVISDFSFSLIGHKIQFTNQVVYFQSKSILDVFWILMEDPDYKMKIVGVLLVTFSIVFPLTKLISSVFYYYDFKGMRKNFLIKFFVLKSAKWSMADVLIVAILMAYIGFNGMVTTQFETLKNSLKPLELYSTNGTHLQVGFYLFLAYVCISMLFSLKIEKAGK